MMTLNISTFFHIEDMKSNFIQSPGILFHLHSFCKTTCRGFYLSSRKSLKISEFFSIFLIFFLHGLRIRGFGTGWWQVLNAMFLVSPKVAYNFSELIEMHAGELTCFRPLFPVNLGSFLFFSWWHFVWPSDMLPCCHGNCMISTMVSFVA